MELNSLKNEISSAIKQFSSGSLSDNGINLFSKLGYVTDIQSHMDSCDYQTFAENYQIYLTKKNFESIQKTFFYAFGELQQMGGGVPVVDAHFIEENRRIKTNFIHMSHDVKHSTCEKTQPQDMKLANDRLTLISK